MSPHGARPSVLPAFTFGPQRAIAWRVAVGAAALLALLSTLAWWQAADAAGQGLPALAALLVAGGCALGALPRVRHGAAGLRWTGSGFRLGDGDDGPAGRVDLCIDLGRFLLLRFRPESGRWPWQAVWLPLRAGEATPGSWHALRCVLYAAPAAGDRRNG